MRQGRLRSVRGAGAGPYRWPSTSSPSRSRCGAAPAARDLPGISSSGSDPSGGAHRGPGGREVGSFSTVPEIRQVNVIGHERQVAAQRQARFGGARATAGAIVMDAARMAVGGSERASICLSGLEAMSLSVISPSTTYPAGRRCGIRQCRLVALPAATRKSRPPSR